MAVQGASMIQHRYADGVFFVDLSSARDERSLGSALVDGARIRLEGEGPVGPRAADDLARRRCLIVLDNCEHLVDEVAAVADAILERCPGVHLLATSRESLEVAGERIVQLGGLDRDDGVDHAVELFFARVGSRARDASEGDVVGLADQLDRLPLAIELAAARTTSLTVPEISQGLRESIEALRSRSRTAPERHLTLSATIDWSYDLLPESLQRVHRQLSVLSGTFDAAAAASVTNEERRAVEEALHELVARSLIEHVPTGSSSRYRQLETIRQHAARLLGAAESETLRERHLNHFEGVALGCWRAEPLASDLTVRDRLSAEEANMVAALEYAEARRERSIPPLAFTQVVRWMANGELALARSWVDRSLEVEGLSPDLRLTFLMYRAWTGTSSNVDFMEHALAARDYARAQAPLEVGVFGEAIAANIPLVLMDPDESRAAAAAMRRACTQSRFGREWSPLVLVYEGTAESVAGDLDAARERFRRAQSGLEAADRDWVAWADIGLASSELLAGEADRARTALDPSRRLRDRFQARELMGLAGTEAAALAGLGRIADANATLQSYCAELCSPARHNINAIALRSVAIVRALSGDHEAAVECFERSAVGGADPFRAPLVWTTYARVRGYQGSMRDFAAREFARAASEPASIWGTEAESARWDLLQRVL
ncbi:MAG: hypothetical protein R2716_08365 [Microthrixaceae bacterium]